MMFIMVELYDGNQVSVCQQGLDRLLENSLVKRFKRSSGWVTVGIDPIRSKLAHQETYLGLDKRHKNHSNRVLH